MSNELPSFDDALEKALRNDPVPDLPAGFADRIVAATEGRAEPLPQSRPAPKSRWRTSRRLVFGAVAAGALATTAAATGLLEELPIELPSAQEVWEAVTGQEPEPAPAPAPVIETPTAPEPEEAVTIEGPIDTPEELEEAFRRVDEARDNRRNTRRENADRQIDDAIVRRRAQGLPAPTPEQEARLRDRIERVRERSDERREARIEERREGLREDVEAGEAITREDFMQRQRGTGSDTPVADRIEELRQLPPAERRARIREWREERRQRRQQRADAPSEPEAPGDDTASTEEPPQQ